MFFRVCLISFLFALPSAAKAMPKVGDFAQFEGVLEGNGHSSRLTASLELTQFDAAQNRFLQRQITAFDGQAPQVEDAWKGADELISDAVADQMLQGCASYGGVSETIRVPAGTFPTCKLPVDGGGVVWLGKVPFGIVKADNTENGMHSVLELRSFH